MTAAPAGRKFFDTNVLVYLFDRSAPAKRDRALEIFEAAVHADEIVLSAQILQEFFAVVTRLSGVGIPVEEAEAEVRRYARLEVVSTDRELVLAAITRSRRSKLSYWDAAVVEAALRARCTTLFSEDLRNGWQIEGQMTVVNPFA